ncbi:hypothetical protein [Endozoicomonas ascidiicola]|uniref:hypothetical protein n=1 Tax=Endozoicomonas ascidiicola TaxID=1698521 RepID=UPI0008356422|nr:hypothetical protein [Endozoicomonas ascidiicola]
MCASHHTEVDDIEIYAKSLSLKTIQQWLENTFDHLVTVNSGKVVHDLEVSYDGKKIPIMIVESAVGKAWTSIWFKSSGTPWEDDTQCARSLNGFAQCRVRCNSGPWQEGADMDEWWQLDESGQDSLIKWPNAS